MDSLPDFLALIEGRPAAEVEHALAVAAAVAHHYDRHRERRMADREEPPFEGPTCEDACVTRANDYEHTTTCKTTWTERAGR